MRDAVVRLIELGLSEKEARVYLAMLELGRASSSAIGKKAEVGRSTAYFVLQALQHRGLAMAIGAERGVEVFEAVSPNQLHAGLDDAARQIEYQRRVFTEALPQFLALYNAMPGKPLIRFFEGESGIVEARMALDRVTEYDAEFLSFSALDEGTMRLAQIMSQQRMKLSRKVKGRALIAIKSGFDFPEVDAKKWKVRQIPFARAPFSGEVNITGSTVAAYACQDQPLAMLVECDAFARLFRALFESAWNCAEEVTNPRARGV